MDVLFLHQNFPGQFLSLAPALVERGHRVVALTVREGLPNPWRGVRIYRYPWRPPDDFRTHRWAASFNMAVARGEAVFRAGLALKKRGFNPDVIVAHTGWGEAMFVGDVWPRARLAAFSELWYRPVGGDLGFDPEFPSRDPSGQASQLRIKNSIQALQIERSQALFSATEWQASTYPEAARKRMAVLHEGVYTNRSCPNPDAVFAPKGGPRLTRKDRVVSFVNRNLEPLRGFHTFMRALPKLLTDDPDLHAVIVGGTGVSYGRAPEGGGSWKDVLLGEVAPALPRGARARIHFTGLLPHADLTALFQITRAHVYLTYPFVPGWSLLEAMSCGAAVVANDVAPVREFISGGENGALVDFFDPEGLAATVHRLVEDRERADGLGQVARRLIVDRYDLKKLCLPRRLDFVESLAFAEPLETADGLEASESLVRDPELSRAG